MLWVLIVLTFVAGVSGHGHGHSHFQLKEKSTLFLPADGRVFDTEVVEDASYDQVNKILYVVGGRYTFVIDMTSPENMKVLMQRFTQDSDTENADIAACGGYFFTTTDNRSQKNKGAIYLEKYNRNTKTLKGIFSKELGADVDSVKFFPGCKVAVATVKGSAYGKDATFVDPKGKVVIIELPDNTEPTDSNIKLTTLDFTAFDARFADLAKEGVRLVYNGNNNPFSNSVDPQSITLSSDGKKAYISLQTANAVAIVDMKTKTITDVKGLGMKDWSNLMMDPSDKDGGINLAKYPLYSYYLPDCLCHFTVDSKNYIVTANEGSSVDYGDLNGFDEEIEGQDFVKDKMLADSVSDQMKTWLADEKKLGRLRFTKRNGEANPNKKYSKFVFFGGRSFSIWEADTMKQVYDSGDLIEKTHATDYPDIFNGEVHGGDTPKVDADKRSRKKGPEPESTAVGKVGERTLIFVGNEAPGSIMVFSIEKDVSKPKFESLWHGVTYTNKTWLAMFNNKETKAIDPETIIFLDKGKSPTGKPGLIVLGAKSSSVTYLDVLPDAVSSAKGLQKSVFVLLVLLLLQLTLRE